MPPTLGQKAAQKAPPAAPAKAPAAAAEEPDQAETETPTPALQIPGSREPDLVGTYTIVPLGPRLKQFIDERGLTPAKAMDLIEELVGVLELVPPIPPAAPTS